MSEPENFLARWSRRKAEGEPDALSPHAAKTDGLELIDPAPGSPAPVQSESQEPNQEIPKKAEVDLASLPSVDSIGAGTDVRGFLQKGVPRELAHAALRRVWSADPAIRDFIGIAENQYDFATGSDIPGFGPLLPEDDVARMVAQITGEGVPRPPVEPAKSAAPLEPDQTISEQQRLTSENAAPATEVTAESEMKDEVAVEHDPPIVQREKIDVAMQNKTDESQEPDSGSPRTHGGALPR